MAFFEFIPKEEISDKLNEWFRDEDCAAQDSDCKNTILNDLAIFILAAFVILLLCFIAFFLFLLKKMNEKVQVMYIKLRNIICYGTFIRTIFLSTLKV